MQTAHKRQHRKSWFENWTVRSQIHLYSIILICVSIACTSSLVFGYLTYKKDYIKTLTLRIQQKETQNQITSYNYLQTRSFKRLLDFSYDSLSTLNDLNHFIEKESINIQMPTDCINNPALWDSYIFQCELCYKFCNSSNNPDDFKQFFQLVSLITEILPISNMYRQTFFTSTDPAQFFTVYKGGNYTKFVAHIRPWYINHMNRTKYENHSFYISDLYLDWIKKLAIAFTVSLTNLDNEMIGVLGYDLSFDLLPAFFDQHLSMDIVNSTGYLLVSSLYETYKVPTQIFNTTITGFTERDWNRLKKFGDDGTIGNGSLRVKNKNTQILYEVSVYKLQYPELYIIIYSTDDKFLLSQQTLLANLDQFEQFIVMETLYYGLGLLVSVLIIQFIIIRYALSNLKQLVILTKQKIFLKFKIKNKQIILHSDKKDAISKLCTAFTKLNQNLTNFKWKKSRLCQNIEKIHYPHKNLEMDAPILEELYNKIFNSKDEIWNMNFYEPQMFLHEVYSRRLTHIQKSFKSMFVQKYGTL